MNRKLITLLSLTAIATGIFPEQRSVAYNESCFAKVHEERGPRPSGYIDSRGRYVEYNYTGLPDPKDLIFACLDGQLIRTDVPIQMEKGSTLIPLRALLESTKAKINWDAATKTVTAELPDKTIRVQVNKSEALVNESPVVLPVPPRLIKGTVFLPLRFFSEQLGYKVAWQPGSKLVKLYTHPHLSVKVAERTNSYHTEDYNYHNFFRVSSRYLIENNGSTVTVEDDSTNLRIQQFTTALQLEKKQVIKKELPLFGGVHTGEDGYYYVVYGQSNHEESDEKAVYRVVKYDHNWAKVSHVDLKGVHVNQPFDASNLTMDSDQGKLVVHSARLRYKSGDGLRHQSNLTFAIDMNEMKVIEQGGEWPENHVSHSFATYVRLDGDRTVYADHGDAYPRSIVLQVEQDQTMKQALNLLKFPGKIGDNYTGAHLGGLEVSNTSYLVTGSSVSLTEQYGRSSTKNVFLAVVPKDAQDDSQVKLSWLTQYSVYSEIEITETHLLKINEDKFVVMWKQSDKGLYYTVVDGSGNVLRKPSLLAGVPSPGNLKPLVRDHTIIWYGYDFVYQEKYTQDGLEFYSLDID